MALKAFVHRYVQGTYELNKLRPSENVAAFVKDSGKIFFGNGFEFTECPFSAEFQERLLFIDTKEKLKKVKAIPGQIVFCTDVKEVYQGDSVSGTRTDWFDSAGQSIQIGGVAFDFEGVYRTTSPNENIKLFSFTQDVLVDVGDGVTPPFAVLANVVTRQTYAVAGDYTVKVTFLAPITDFNSAFQYAENLVELVSLNSGLATNFDNCWEYCIELVSFPVIDMSNALSIIYTWGECIKLVSFPLLDLSNVLNARLAWYTCTNLTTFPLLNLSSCQNFSFTWQDCNLLVTLPAIDFSSGTDFNRTFSMMSSLTDIEALNLSSLLIGEFTFELCPLLAQPPATGTPVRNNDNATAGTWIHP